MEPAAAEAPKRVLLACDHLVRYTVGLARGLAANGCATALLTRTHDAEFGGVRGAMGAYVRTGAPASIHEQVPGRVRDFAALAGVWHARRALGRFAPDVVHLQDSALTDPRLAVAARARPGRYALTVHDVEVHPGDNPLSARAERFWHALIARAGLIFVHGESLREGLLAERRPAAPIVVVPHGAEPRSAPPLPSRPSLLFFGRISRYKGLDTLLDAMPSVWERVPDARLEIAGAGELPDHPVLSDARVEVRNAFVPEAEVAATFARATCVVLPYREASQSGVAAQAREYGRPVVATSVGALADLAADGSAQVVSPTAPELAAAMVDVVSTPGRAEEMSAQAAAAAASGSSWERVGELTLAAYRRYLPLG